MIVRFAWMAGATLCLALLACAPAEEAGEVSGDWEMFRGDLAGSGYSPLAEITPSNVGQLEEVWRLPLAGAPPEDESEPRRAFSQATPIVVSGTMFVPTADSVLALDPVTGAERWRYTLPEGRPSRRGVAYWPGATDVPARILFTAGARLVALDAASGMPVPGFGAGGSADMGVPYLSVPLVFEDLVVVGANTPRPGQPRNGNTRAFSALTGEKVWELHSVPQPGESGHETWGDGWQDRLGANAWPFYFTLDEERGHVYLPLAAPIPFGYGGDRPGANLYANSVVAVDVRTGAYRWHFQTIHHDLWDHDPPAPPVLFTARFDGSPRDALAVTTKSGYLFVLDRDNGQPLHVVEEREVPQSEVPTEQSWPTQPFPSRPGPLARVSFAESDLVTTSDTTPEHVAACEELLRSMGDVTFGGPYVPWVYRGPDDPPRATLLFPGLAGGHNWGGVAHDASQGTLLVFSKDVGTFGWIEDAPDDAPDRVARPYQLKVPRPGNFEVRMEGQAWPCQKPPWGRLSAVDASTGEVRWQRAIGITEGLPEGKQATGRPGHAAALATASGVVFLASTDDNRLRALDGASGNELWVTDLGGHGNSNPMSYRGADGRQYVAVTATEELAVFRLP